MMSSVSSNGRIDVRSADELRRMSARALERAPSDRVFDNRLNPPRSDYDLNPGWRSELANVQPRPAAVLVPIVDRAEGLTVLLTQRPETMPTHAGQIAFPGGKMDRGDDSPVATALREAEEEIGLDRTRVDLLGFLDCYQTGTGFRVVPVVALVAPPFTLRVDPREVADVFEVPLAFLMDRSNHHTHSREYRGVTRHFYAMPYGERYIWGATAGMLRNLYERLGG
jgi:8-oxo-dGTP pyrophosphatase MutT (NUDIX family)